jgi:predicted ester cyclase
LEKKNKETIERYYADVISGRDYSNLSNLVAAEYVDHNAEAGGRGPEVVRKHMEAMRTTLPDFTMCVEQIVAEGDWVATRVTGRGTHKGEWMNIKPTGREIRLRGINLDRLKDGKIVEHWGEADTIGMLLQMGIDPFAGKGS